MSIALRTDRANPQITKADGKGQPLKYWDTEAINFMTPEERLSQIEALLGTTAKYINRHEALLTRHEELLARQEELHNQYQEQILEVNLRMANAASMVAELAAVARQNEEANRQNREEIRRIWEYLMSQRPENGHSGE